MGPELGEAYCRDTCDVRRNGRCCKGVNGATHDCPAPPLLAENEPIVRAYYACNTQWRTGAMGRTGLDYAACVIATDAQRERLQLPAFADLLPGLQTIEHALLGADAELRERERERAERERMNGRQN